MLIYGGSAYSYSVDPEFKEVGYSEKRWQEVIDEYYLKYKGMAQWHKLLMHTATTTGKLVMPTGRIYTFTPEKKRDDIVWPRTTILNYPVQGLGADLVAIARVSAWKRIRGLKSLLVSSVHDSIVIDSIYDEIELLCKILKSSVEDVPKNFERLFKVPFDLPLNVEIQIGEDLKNTVDISVFSCYNI